MLTLQDNDRGSTDGTNGVWLSQRYRQELKNMVKYVGAGMSEHTRLERKPMKDTLWATKSNFFDTYEEFPRGGTQDWKGVWGCAAVMTPFFQSQSAAP